MPKKTVKWAVFKEGKLGGWKKTLPAADRRRILAKIMKKDSYATTIRRLVQLRNVTQDKATVTKASADLLFLRKKHAERPKKHKGRMC